MCAKIAAREPIHAQGAKMVWVTRVCDPTVARPIGLALCRRRMPMGAEKTGVGTSNRKVERGAEGVIISG